jgi:hypothetical protein
MRDSEITLGATSYRIAMPLGALDDLAGRGFDPIQLAMNYEKALTTPAVKAIIDVAGAWAVDPERGRPAANAHRLSFAEVYNHPSAGGLGTALMIAKAALSLAFSGGDDENPSEGEGNG